MEGSIQKLTSELTKLLPKNMALKNQSTLQNEYEEIIQKNIFHYMRFL